jgi:hydroxymethylpyrimidine/phosphomethylpyrimidine kinase
MRTALTYAGSDPSGGAGIQADLRTFTALGVYGLCIITAVTAQDTARVTGIYGIPKEILNAQMEGILQDLPVHAIKSGMLYSEESVEVLRDSLKRHSSIPYVMDPVIRASDGTPLLKPGALEALICHLIPMATLITPNLQEAETLSGIDVGDEMGMREAAKRIHGLGPRYVLIKGGHLAAEPADLLFDGREFETFSGERISGKPIRGTGCVLSAAVTAFLAEGADVREAVSKAKTFITRAIRGALPLGRGGAVLFDLSSLYK